MSGSEVSCPSAIYNFANMRRSLGLTLVINTIPYHTIPYRTIPYHTVTYRTIPYHTIPYRTIPYHTIPYVPCHTILYPTIPYRTIPYHTVPYCTISYHTLPYHTIPYRTVPYHTIPYHTCQLPGMSSMLLIFLYPFFYLQNTRLKTAYSSRQTLGSISILHPTTRPSQLFEGRLALTQG